METAELEGQVSRSNEELRQSSEAVYCGSSDQSELAIDKKNAYAQDSWPEQNCGGECDG